MKAKRKGIWFGVGVYGLILMVLLSVVPLANGAKTQKDSQAVDSDQYSEFMDHMVLGLEDLAEGAEIQREFFNTITPPGVELFQPMFPSAVPFEDEDFTENFLKGLLGWDRNSVTVYPVQLFLDSETRQTLIYNLDGELIAASSNLWGPRIELGGDSPTRIVLLQELVPAADVEFFLYSQKRIYQSLMEIVSQTRSIDSTSSRSSGGTNVFEVIEIETTNSSMAVTFAWPATFTNRFDIYSFDGGGFTGRVAWSLADVGHVSSGTNQLRWIDAGQLGRMDPGDLNVRFYCAGNADVDSDGDGYSDSYEFLSLHTATNNADTDGDGISDGPLSVGTTITNGPDAFPFDPTEWLDTDGDGIGDNTDTDDDGDGILDTAETGLYTLMPRTVAPFRVVTVEDADPAGDDSGAEVFDVSSAGRMLPYASGGDARGHGQIHGGIFFNNDGTNLYIGVAGFEKDGSNSLMIFLDTDGTGGGASSLAGISGDPSAFGQADNLSFSPDQFTPNVGILAGNRYGDGRNYASGLDFGQGVYALTPTTVSDFPGFSSGSGAISQWGDRNTDSANAGIEMVLSLSSLGLGPGDTFKAAAIINGGAMGSDNRWFSGECYGESAGGTLNGNNFESNAVTLVGAEVYLSASPAPEPGSPPPFTEDDVLLQGYYWEVPRVPLSNYTGVCVMGNFNSWNYGSSPMTLIDNYKWERIETFSGPTNLQLKFRTADSVWWGSTNVQKWLTLPVSGQNGLSSPGADNIYLTNVSGTVRFRAVLNGSSSSFTAEYVSPTSTTKLISGFSTNFWYERIKTQAENGELDPFTMVWLPQPVKCNSGRDSVGYDPFDYYDIGTYAEKFSVETRYGSETNLKECVTALRSRGKVPMIDLVLNHMNGGYTAEGGTNRYNYQPASHETFEKPDPHGDNSNQYFTVNYANQPFSYDVGYGNGDGVNAWDANATSADVNQRHPYQRQGLKNWAAWVSSKVGYRGYRWDVAQNIEPWFISELMNYSVMKGQPAVMEFWTENEQATVQEFETWIELTDRRSAMFDQRLYAHLKDMCNYDGVTTFFDMSILRNGGLFAVKPQWAVTLVGDHDKIRPYDSTKAGITKDKAMAYAFILISEGTPMVTYNDYFIGPYVDFDPPDDPIDDGWTGTPLSSEIDRLIKARRAFAGGSTTYLSQSNTNDLFIMKRAGDDFKPGCILVLNDHPTSTLSDTVNTGWANTNLVDFIHTNAPAIQTDGSGNATLNAPARGYRVYIKEGDL